MGKLSMLICSAPLLALVGCAVVDLGGGRSVVPAAVYENQGRVIVGMGLSFAATHPTVDLLNPEHKTAGGWEDRKGDYKPGDEFRATASKPEDKASEPEADEAPIDEETGVAVAELTHKEKPTPDASKSGELKAKSEEQTVKSGEVSGKSGELPKAVAVAPEGGKLEGGKPVEDPPLELVMLTADNCRGCRSAEAYFASPEGLALPVKIKRIKVGERDYPRWAERLGNPVIYWQTAAGPRYVAGWDGIDDLAEKINRNNDGGKIRIKLPGDRALFRSVEKTKSLTVGGVGSCPCGAGCTCGPGCTCPDNCRSDCVCRSRLDLQTGGAYYLRATGQGIRDIPAIWGKGCKSRARASRRCGSVGGRRSVRFVAYSPGIDSGDPAEVWRDDIAARRVDLRTGAEAMRAGSSGVPPLPRDVMAELFKAVSGNDYPPGEKFGVRFPASWSITFANSPERITATFSSPGPSISSRVMGFRFSDRLVSLEATPDSAAVTLATYGKIPFKVE